MTDAAGHTTTYAYDALGRQGGRTDALGGALTWTYDALGNRTAQQNRSDPIPTLSVAWTYDPFGRMLTRTADSVTTTYTYDQNGNKLSASDGTLTITATYDRLDRVLTVDDEDAGTTADTSYAYSLTAPSWSDPSGSYAAVLDKFDRQTSLDEPADAGASNMTWTYRSDGQPSAMSYPNGNSTAFVYDALGRLASKDTTAAGPTSRALYDWTWNRAGQVLTEAETVTGGASNGTISYAYDPLGQLTGSTLSGTTTSYGWDKVPNRTSVQVGGGTAATTSYDAADRPTSGASPTAAYTSNADGMLTARPGQTLTWDHLGRLTAVKNAAGSVTLASYTYDPLDRLRTAADGAGSRVRFRYTGLTTGVAQWWDDVAGTVTRSVGNDWTGERLMDWTGSGSSQRYYGTNAHHDVTWLAGTSGAVSGSLRYDPFGNARTAVPSGYAPFRFQGSWYDANSDLSWVVTRWYAPALGRFVSEDSLLGEPAQPDSRHLYAYAAGEPIGYWDPDGRLRIPFSAEVPMPGPEIFVWGGHTFTGRFIGDKLWARTLVWAWDNHGFANVDRIDVFTTIEECGNDFFGWTCIGWGRQLARDPGRFNPAGVPGIPWIRWGKRVAVNVEPGAIYRVKTVFNAFLRNPRQHAKHEQVQEIRA